MNRYSCLKMLGSKITDELVVTNLANTANEWRAVRNSDANLYAVGMGMVTPYTVGLALALPNRKIVALDGDGGVLFDTSIFGVIAKYNINNICVIIFDNEGYVSTGNYESTCSLTHGFVKIENIIKGYGINDVYTVSNSEDVAGLYEKWNTKIDGPMVIIVKIDHSQAFVGPTTMDAKENKYRFVRHIENLENINILKASAREHGAPPVKDPESRAANDNDEFAQVIYEGLHENGFDLIVGLPCSGMSKPQSYCCNNNDIKYIGVSNEGTGFAICAGAWLGGKKPAALVENFGLFAGSYHLMRGQYHFGIPLLIVAEYRGDAGDTEFWSKAGEVTEDVIRALRINYKYVDEMYKLKPAIRDGSKWINFGLRPYVVLPSFRLSKPK